MSAVICKHENVTDRENGQRKPGTNSLSDGECSPNGRARTASEPAGACNKKVVQEVGVLTSVRGVVVMVVVMVVGVGGKQRRKAPNVLGALLIGVGCRPTEFTAAQVESGRCR